MEDATLKSHFLSGLRSRELKLRLYNASEGKSFAETVKEMALLEILQKSVNKGHAAPAVSQDVNAVGTKNKMAVASALVVRKEGTRVSRGIKKPKD